MPQKIIPSKHTVCTGKQYTITKSELLVYLDVGGWQSNEKGEAKTTFAILSGRLLILMDYLGIYEYFDEKWKTSHNVNGIPKRKIEDLKEHMYVNLSSNVKNFFNSMQRDYHIIAAYQFQENIIPEDQTIFFLPDLHLHPFKGSLYDNFIFNENQYNGMNFIGPLGKTSLKSLESILVELIELFKIIPNSFLLQLGDQYELWEAYTIIHDIFKPKQPIGLELFTIYLGTYTMISGDRGDMFKQYNEYLKKFYSFWETYAIEYRKKFNPSHFNLELTKAVDKDLTKACNSMVKELKYQYPFLFNTLDSLYRVDENTFIRSSSKIQYYSLRGNHDNWLDAEKYAYEITMGSNNNIIALHGHIADENNNTVDEEKKKKRIESGNPLCGAEVVQKLVCLCERNGLGDELKCLEGPFTDVKMTPEKIKHILIDKSTATTMREIYFNYFRDRFLSDSRLKLCVMAHTHRPLLALLEIKGSSDRTCKAKVDKIENAIYNRYKAKVNKIENDTYNTAYKGGIFLESLTKYVFGKYLMFPFN